MEQLTFGWIDYFVFTSLLGVSVLIGLYFAFCSKQNTVSDYLYAGKSMSYIPVAISGLSSYLSGITYLGNPTEIYLHGTQYVMIIIAAFISVTITNRVFLPVFFKLQLLCVTEYLELRFSKAVRKICSISYLIALIVYSAIIIYAPALAFAQLTGINLHIFTPALYVICIFYTSIGGIKAVIWTDTFQFIFTLGGVISILIIGITTVGGISKIWEISAEGQRLIFFNMNISIFERCTFWAVILHGVFSDLGGFACSQKFVQKLLSINEEKEARKAVWFILFGSVTLRYVCFILGLIMYTKYHDCDPVKAKYIQRIDQLLPFFVMDVVGDKPGLAGIFLAGLISSALATLSATLNTLGSVIYDDFLKDNLPESFKEESKAANTIKVIVVVIGFAATGFIFIAEKMGTIFELSVSFFSILTGPLLGLFVMGMVLPWIGKKGALVGGYASLVFMMWLVWGTQWHVMNHRIRYENLPTSTRACPYPLNETITETSTLSHIETQNEPLAIFRVSMLYYSLIGTAISICTGIIVSYFSKEMDLTKVNPDYISPVLHRFLPKREYVEVPLEPKGTTEKLTGNARY